MKRAIRNALGVTGLLLMIASLVWISFHQERRPAVYKESKAIQPQTSKPFAVVVLDPGHGGEDSGAMCGGVMEKDLTLDVARRVDRLLDSEGVATLMTRLGDSYVSLADRAAFGNRVKESIFISIHFNEDNKPVASGVETYYAAHQIDSFSTFASWLPFFSGPPSNSPKPESQSLAGFIQEALVARAVAAGRPLWEILPAAADVDGTWNGTSKAEGDTTVNRFTVTGAPGDSVGKFIAEGSKDTVTFTRRLDADSMMVQSVAYTDPGMPKGTGQVMFKAVGRLKDGKLVGTSQLVLASKPDSVLGRSTWEATRAP